MYIPWRAWLWRFKNRFCFRWVSDREGDIGITFFRIVTMVKYKDSTIVRWFTHFDDAGKWQGYAGEE